MFISFEGVEGSGKTTQAKRLAAALRANGQQCVLTKEPGGTPLADRIRAILLDPQEEGMDPLTELLLYAASRRQHVVEVIAPAIEAGTIVITDRYTDATLAYQGYGRALDLGRLQTLNDWATDRIYPDVTVIFDLPENVGLKRAKSRNESSEVLLKESRLEGEDLRFHRRVREGYLALAQTAPERYLIVDAGGEVDEVYARLTAALAERLPGLRLGTSSV
jgi:dTMP kinase